LVFEALQEAVRTHDRAYLDAAVSDRMIWVLPQSDNGRGKQDWIDASLGVTWNWFEVDVLRQLNLGDTRVVEFWVRQSRQAVAGEDPDHPVTAAGVVLDVWAVENGAWRLLVRHPQRADDAG
jgi:hypothetical protein